jgi:ABC-type uncharacterized transport system substrate-binding protein
VYRIGVVTEAWAANHPTVLGLKAGLREQGLEEGRDIAFDVRFTQGKPEETPAAADALVKDGVDLLFTSGVASTLAAKAATDKLPIVFAQVSDPVAVGAVSDLVRPGRNVTGVSSLATELMPKRLEVLKTLEPSVRRVWFVHARDDVTAGTALARVRDVAPQFDVELVAMPVVDAQDVARIRGELRRGDALLAPDTDAVDIPAGVLKLSLAARVPAVFPSSLWVGYGGLVSYGPDYFAQGMQAARLVAKILKGARPGDLPVEGVDAIDLAVNLRTAALLDIAVPRKVLLRADTIRR